MTEKMMTVEIAVAEDTRSARIGLCVRGLDLKEYTKSGKWEADKASIISDRFPNYTASAGAKTAHRLQFVFVVPTEEGTTAAQVWDTMMGSVLDWRCLTATFGDFAGIATLND
jgi:hypothetical protein